MISDHLKKKKHQKTYLVSELLWNLMVFSVLIVKFEHSFGIIGILKQRILI